MQTAYISCSCSIIRQGIVQILLAHLNSAVSSENPEVPSEKIFLIGEAGLDFWVRVGFFGAVACRDPGGACYGPRV